MTYFAGLNSLFARAAQLQRRKLDPTRYLELEDASILASAIDEYLKGWRTKSELRQFLDDYCALYRW